VVETLQYQALWDNAEGETFDDRLDAIWPDLTNGWLELYKKGLSSEGVYDLVWRDRFMYAHDTRLYPQDVEFDYKTMVDDRVIFVAGVSDYIPEKRDMYNMRGPLSSREFGPARRDCPFDRGHFIAHSIGGHEDMGLFPQRRDVNQGRGEFGRVYAAMERYCREHPGTFVFSRPIYGDNTGHPFWVEYGVLREDREFWVEVFPNRYSFTPYLGLETAPQWYQDWVARERLAVERGRVRAARRRERETGESGSR
jgi:hypothetical protein